MGQGFYNRKSKISLTSYFKIDQWEMYNEEKKAEFKTLFTPWIFMFTQIHLIQQRNRCYFNRTTTLQHLIFLQYTKIHCNKQMQFWCHIPPLLGNFVAIIVPIHWYTTCQKMISWLILCLPGWFCVLPTT